MTQLFWKKYHPLTDENAYICLVDHMGDDASITQAARTSYGLDTQETTPETTTKDRGLIRRLMNDQHTSPFEMVEFKFMVQVPMDCWRQWIRHRTANVNEYSTRYMEALDMFHVTHPTQWRLQSKDNKQGSSGYLEEWPENWEGPDEETKYTAYGPVKTTESIGRYLSSREESFHNSAKELYKERLEAGVAREQARKDLPLSTYTRAYWKCDLHNILNFLRLRMDSHAQQEIRYFANAMYDIVSQICPIACEAFDDYVLNAVRFSRMEMELIRNLIAINADGEIGGTDMTIYSKPESMTNNEWNNFVKKLS